MNDTQKQLAREVFAHILTDPQHWNQNVWCATIAEGGEGVEYDTFPLMAEDGADLSTMVTGGVKGADCGTAMCFAGWTNLVADKETKLIWQGSGANHVLVNGRAHALQAHARTLLGLDHDEADRLFAGGNTIQDLFRILDEFEVWDELPDAVVG